MNDISIFRLTAQLAVLREVEKAFPHRTIENVISNIEAILKVRNQREGDLQGL